MLQLDAAGNFWLNSMLLSLSHGFLFVHIPKTAGSSLTELLRPICVTPPRTLIRSVMRRLPIKEDPARAHFRVHETAEFIQRKLSKPIFDQLYSFCVVRNPYDHAFSHYLYMRQFRSAKIARFFAALSFEDYLRYRLQPARLWDEKFARLPDQAHFVVDRSGTVMVDQVLRFETLSTDMGTITARLGLPSAPLERINPTTAKAGRVSLADNYSAEAIALVQALYARDFKLFGYSSDLALAEVPS